MNNNKNILYIMRFWADRPFNLKQKFLGQLSSLNNMDNNVYYIIFSNDGVYLAQYGHEEKAQLLFKPFAYNMPHYDHIYIFNDLAKAIRKIAKIMKFDIVYMRKMPCFNSILHSVIKLKKLSMCKLIYEIPTYPFSSSHSELSKLKQLAFAHFDRNLKKLEEHIDMYAIIGTFDDKVYKHKPAVSIENSIDISSLAIRKPVMEKDTVNIMLLASMQQFHGFDRMIMGLSSIKPQYNICYHFIGQDMDGSLKRWLNLAKELKVEEYIKVYGPTYNDDLNKLFNLCDAGIGALGLHRQNAHKSSTLKIREYLGRGLPIICDNSDSVIAENLEFTMEVPSDDSPIDPNKIAEFALKMREIDNLPVKIREYCSKNLSWETQWKKVFNRLEEIR